MDTVSAAREWWWLESEWYGDAQTARPQYHNIWKYGNKVCDLIPIRRLAYKGEEEPHSPLSESLCKAISLQFPQQRWRLCSKPSPKMNDFRGHYICSFNFGLPPPSDDSVEGYKQLMQIIMFGFCISNPWVVVFWANLQKLSKSTFKRISVLLMWPWKCSVMASIAEGCNLYQKGISIFNFVHCWVVEHILISLHAMRVTSMVTLGCNQGWSLITQIQQNY